MLETGVRMNSIKTARISSNENNSISNIDYRNKSVKYVLLHINQELKLPFEVG